MLIIIVSFFPFLPAHSQVHWIWEKTARGLECCSQQFELSGVVQSVAVVRYRATRHKTGIYCANGPLADSTSALAERINALAALNAGYFNMKTLEPVSYIWQACNGVVGRTSPGELFRIDGVLAVKRSGKIRVIRCDTTSYAGLKGYSEAIATGPVLLLGGVPARDSWPEYGFFQNRHPRSVIGRDERNRVYMIVIDGRLAGQGEGASIAETVEICKMIGLKDAINFDGGGSSLLWEKQKGVLSYPCGNRKYDHYGQRVVPNILYIK